MKHPHSRGFSLIELVLVMIILSIAGVAILAQFAQLGPGLLADESIQTATQLAQERAEQVLAERRASGYAAIPVGTVTDDLSTTSYSNYIRTVTTSAYTGAACPVSDCRQVVITVSRDGSTQAELNLMVANY